jgi:hypothetical protein
MITSSSCAISREYDAGGSPGYWYAFHPHQAERLQAAKTPYISFACGSASKVLLIPFAEFAPILPTLNVTKLEDRTYWHVQIFEEGNQLVLRPKKGNTKVTLTRYLVPA